MKRTLTAGQIANKLAAEQLKPLRKYLLNGARGKDVEGSCAKTPKPGEPLTAGQMASELAAKQLEPIRKYLLD